MAPKRTGWVCAWADGPHDIPCCERAAWYVNQLGAGVIGLSRDPPFWDLRPAGEMFFCHVHRRSFLDMFGNLFSRHDITPAKDFRPRVEREKLQTLEAKLAGEASTLLANGLFSHLPVSEQALLHRQTNFTYRFFPIPTLQSILRGIWSFEECNRERVPTKKQYQDLQEKMRRMAEDVFEEKMTARLDRYNGRKQLGRR